MDLDMVSSQAFRSANLSSMQVDIVVCDQNIPLCFMWRQVT